MKTNERQRRVRPAQRVLAFLLIAGLILAFPSAGQSLSHESNEYNQIAYSAGDSNTVVVTDRPRSGQNTQKNGNAPHWSMTTKITNADGSPSDSFGPGDKIRLSFLLQIGASSLEFQEDMLSGQFVFYVSKEALPDAFYNFVNPIIPNSGGVRMFVNGNTAGNKNPEEYIPEDFLLSPASAAVDKNGKPYYRYVLQFNRSKAAMDVHRDSPPLTFSFEAFGTLTTATNVDISYPIVTVEGSAEGILTEIKIPPITPPEYDGGASVNKRVPYVLRLGTYSGSDTDKGYGQVVSRNGNPTYIQKDDLVIFSIEVKATQNKGAIIERIADQLGSGFTFLDAGSLLEFQAGIGGDFEQFANNPVTVGQIVNKLYKMDYLWKQSGAEYIWEFPGGLQLDKGASKTFYLVAKVNENSPAGLDYSNTASANVKGTPDPVKGPIVGFPPITGSAEHDMALVLQPRRLFDRTGAGRDVPGIYDVQMNKDGYVRMNVHLYNHKPSMVKNICVRIYIPDGLEMVRENPETGPDMKQTNSGWTAAGAVSPAWSSSLTAYENTFQEVLPPGTGNNTANGRWEALTFYLKVKDSYKDVTITENNLDDFHVGAEIVSFADYKGAPVVADTDSTPDGNSANDLNGTDITHFALMKRGQSVTPKEIMNRITDDCKSNPEQDEDDFDFCWINGLLSESGQGEGPEYKMLEKRVVKNQSATQSLFNSLVPGDYRSQFEGFVPLPTNGLITNPKTYVAYEIDINEHGYELLHGNGGDIPNAVFEELIPDELDLLSYPDKTGKIRYGFRLTRIHGNPKAVDKDTGRTYIDYTGNNVFKSTLVCNSIGGDSQKASAAQANQMDAAKFGVSADFSGKTLRLTFGKSESDKEPYVFGDVAYKLEVLLVLNAKALTDDMIENEATLRYGKKQMTQTSEDIVEWDASASGSNINKYILDENGVEVNRNAPVVLPDSSGQVKLDFRVKVNTNNSFNKGDISFTDIGGAPWFSHIVDDRITITAEKGSPSMSAAVQSGGFRGWNHAAIPSENNTHTFAFQSVYKDVPYGVALKNTAMKTVYAVVPMKLSLTKRDNGDSAVLRGYEFEVHYAGGDGMPAGEVKDLDGNPVIFRSPEDSFLLVPRDYTPGRTYEQNILFIETKSPTGYPDAQRRFLAKITADAQNRLVISSSDGDLRVSAGEKRESQLTVYNTKTEEPAPKQPTLTLQKQDQDGDPLGGTPENPILFAIRQTGGILGELLDVDGQGNTRVVTLPEGRYRIEETRVPTGYRADEAASGSFVVEKSADGSALQLRMDTGTTSRNLTLAGNAADGYTFTAKNIRTETGGEDPPTPTPGGEDPPAPTPGGEDPPAPTPGGEDPPAPTPGGEDPPIQIPDDVDTPTAGPGSVAETPGADAAPEQNTTVTIDDVEPPLASAPENQVEIEDATPPLSAIPILGSNVIVRVMAALLLLIGAGAVLYRLNPQWKKEGDHKN